MEETESATYKSNASGDTVSHLIIRTTGISRVVDHAGSGSCS